MPKKTIIIFVLALISLLVFKVSCSFAVAIIDISDPNNPDIYTGIESPNDGSIWRVVDGRPTGTGVYEPFLRYQKKGVETGLNTDLKPPPFDDKMPVDQYTRSVLFSDLDVVDFDGSDYFSFTIDFNEPGSSGDRFLSFDNFDLYQGSSPVLGGGDSLTGLTLMFDSNTTVLTDYTLASSGSGNDDIEFLIPFFTWTEPYMYLHITSGGYVDPNGVIDWSAIDGFEEIRTTGIPAPPIPEPATLILLGLGLAGLVGLKRKNYKG